MKRIIAIACMLVLLAPMPALAADLVIDAPDTVLKDEPFEITVTADGSPVAEAIVIYSLGGANFIRATDTSGMDTFTPTTITAQKSGYTTNSTTIAVVESMVTDDLTIEAPDTVLKDEPFEITVTADGSPVAEAIVIYSLGGANFIRATDTSGMDTFTPTTRAAKRSQLRNRRSQAI
jgi:uncharacterized GH25 family protein